MRKVFAVLIAIPVLAALVLAGVIAFGTPPMPEPMPRIAEVFADVDLSDLPERRWLTARDGSRLAYRHYEPADSADDGPVVLALHGSAGDGRMLHRLARRLSDGGAHVYVPDIRGHGDSGTRGDVGYLGQPVDDTEDMVAEILERRQNEQLVLLGYSSGGGLAMSYAGGRDTGRVAHLVMVAPHLGAQSAPFVEDNPHASEGGFARPYMPRIIGLSILNEMGIHAFDHLPAIAFAVEPDSEWTVATNSYRLIASVVPLDHRPLLDRTRTGVTLIGGSHDEVFAADHYAPALHEVRPDAEILLLDGLGHFDVILDDEALEVIADTILGHEGA